MSRDRDYIKMINSTRWLRLRHEMVEAHPYCQDCLEAGYHRPTQEVHHIRPVEWAKTFAEKEQRMFDPHNLRCLCRECHRSAHRKLCSAARRPSLEERIKREKRDAIKRLYGDDINKTL